MDAVYPQNLESLARCFAAQLTATTDRAARAEEQARGLDIKIGELRQLVAAAELRLKAATEGLERERDARILADGRAEERRGLWCKRPDLARIGFPQRLG